MIDRQTVDRLLAEMQATSVTGEEWQRFARIERAITCTLEQHLYQHRAAVWECEALVAAYEFAAAHTALAMFDATWAKIERRWNFKAERYPLPPVTVRTRE